MVTWVFGGQCVSSQMAQEAGKGSASWAMGQADTSYIEASWALGVLGVADIHQTPACAR